MPLPSNAVESNPTITPQGAQSQESVVDDNVLNSIFGEQDAAQSPAMGEQAKQNAQPQAPVEKEKGRFEYWQGQADIYRKMAEDAKPLAEEFKRFQPVIDYLKENPDVIDQVIASKEGKQVQPQVKGQTAQLPSVQPVPPTKPSTYDEIAAYQDPQSESFKFRVKYDDYVRQLTEFMYAKQERTEQELQKQREFEKQKQMEQVRLGEVAMKLQSQFGFTKEDSVDFINVMNSPESMSFENMVNLYKVIKHRTKNVAALRREANPTQQMPPPPIGGNGGFQPQMDENDEFVSGIFGLGQQKRNELTPSRGMF
jgi:hypothetical protein